MSAEQPRDPRNARTDRQQREAQIAEQPSGDAVREGDALRPKRQDPQSLAELLLQSQAPDEISEVYRGEENQDHVLGNLKEEEVWERRHNIKTQTEFIEAMHPPEESVLQGDIRDRFGLEGMKYPLRPDMLHHLHDSEDAAIARSTRSREGFEREMVNKSISEVHRVDELKGQREEQGGGLFSRLLGGGS